jgi:tRNA 2-thiouridine synthesizing protein B
MNLHQVFTSPSSDFQLQQCIKRCQSGDGILLLQDGIYSLKHPLLGRALELDIVLYVLQKDAEARGLAIDNQSVQVVDDKQWLALCVQYDKVISWV